MLLLETTKEFIMFPLTGPVDQATLETYPVYVALMAEDAGEPAAGDWKPGTWLNHEAALKYTEGDYPPGDYLLYGKVVTAGNEEAPVMMSGRVRIGDVRS